ncbi:DNA-directed RNA polymerase I subunit [Penicillium argentinense]|uniref:DNA-directed RNA polymerase subunit n=1 Tax=Penicillium argentinense TaxID=1131581 RepID=A0A9W9KEC4_9EURO|nr:DNA-directed RNA polymerase I subunit [Penicillium argentinense]KAJ5102721.1 DNA-directed RNA polymerase I subunit [Penicillium argentinense]
MSAIGSLIFCTDCGNLLRESTGDADAILHCDVCGTRNKDTTPQTIVSESKPSAFPSALRSKRSAVQTLSAEDRKTEAVTNHTCEKCGRKEMFFTTVQLRSADEGSTVFLRCVCGHKYVINSTINFTPYQSSIKPS